MKDTAYFLAAVPEPVRCLGRRLKPFSVGHQIILQRFESAFVCGATPTFEDLIFGIAICSRSYPGALRFLDSPLSSIWLRWWGFKIWIAVLGGLNLAKSGAVFAAYVQSGSTYPCVKFKESKNIHEIRVPLVATVKTFLIRCGHSEAEALAKPYGLALWEYSIANACEGRNEIVGEEWQREYREFSITPQEEIDRWLAAARRGANN